MTGQGRGEIRQLLDSHGLRPRKHLGQHFLADPNIVQRIIATAEVRPGDRIVEIGAGTGTLTKALFGVGASVIAYEIDEDLRPVLDAVLDGTDVDVRYGDAAKLDLAEELEDGPWTMVANLPYGVGTTLLLDALTGAPNIVRFVVMVQREVADRLVATPGSKTYGSATVVAALHATVEIAFTVGPSVFVPPPDVESAVLVVDRIEMDSAAPSARRIAAAAFNQRRKMVRRSLRSILDDPTSALVAAGIDPMLRAENLTPDDYLRLARTLP